MSRSRAESYERASDLGISIDLARFQNISIDDNAPVQIQSCVQRSIYAGGQIERGMTHEGNYLR